MHSVRIRSRSFRWALAALPFALSQAQAAQVTATWGSVATGLYATPTNWDIGVVPLNGAVNTYIVSIGPNKTVGYDIPGARQIDQLRLDVGARFNLSSSSLISKSQLTVLDTASIAGSISADNASFTALASGTAFLGKSSTVSASNGGVVKIGATSLDQTGTGGNATVLGATGAGSLLDLSSLTSLDIGQNNGSNSYITATGGGKINLSGVTTLMAPASNAALYFTINGGSSVDLSSLQKISGATAESSYTVFNIDGASATLKSVQSANRLGVSLSNAGTMLLSSGGATASLTSSTFAAASGGKLDASTLIGTLNERNTGGNATLLSATGTGSLLDLSAITSLDIGQNNGSNSYINATGGGKINLSGVTTLVAPASNAALYFTINGGSSVDLSSLQKISGVTVDSGYTVFNIDGASAMLKSVQSANRLGVSLSNAGTMLLSSGGATASLTNSTFAAASGGKLDASTLIGTLNERGTGGNAVLLSATGTGSLLDLSAITSLDIGQNTGSNSYINATGGGKIDLSGVTTLVAPASNAALYFTINGGSSVDLSSLQKISGVTADSGYTVFNIDGASSTLKSVQSANRLGVSLSNAGTMLLSSGGATASLTSSTFAAASGGKLDASTLIGTLNERGTGGNAVLLSATGTGSLLDLSAITSLDIGQNTGSNSYINATGGGKIDLSGVTTLVAPASNAALYFTINGGSSIDLSSLQKISGVTVDSGYTVFNIDGASATLKSVQNANRLGVSLSNAGTMLLSSGGATASLTNSTFAAASAGKLDASTLISTLNERGTGGNAVLLSATGSGSLLDLSAITSLDIGQNTGSNSYINATGGGKINLSGVTTLVAPASNAALYFTINGGSSIDLSSLQKISGVTADSGYTVFNIDGASAMLKSVQSANRLGVSLSNAGTMLLSSGGATASLTNSTFAAASGGKLDASTLIGTLNERGTGGNAVLLSAAGSGSVLDLRGLTSLDAGQSTGSNSYINATSGGTINLSGLTTLVAPSANGAVQFQAAGGSIDLSQLQNISNPAGRVNFSASAGGSLLLHGLNAGSGVNFSAADASSRITVNGSLQLRSGSAMVAGAGTTVEVRGDYSFAQTVAAQMNLDAATLLLDGSGSQLLEVGGKRLASLTAGKPVNGNFGIGELDIGATSQATSVTLQDAIDNGNRAGGKEVLYLNGANGNGLHILGGSTLYLNGLDLYTTQGGNWVHVNDLFVNGNTRISYDQGFIVSTSAVPEPSQWGLLAMGLVGSAGRLRGRRPNPG